MIEHDIDDAPPGSSEWLGLRLGKPSASSASRLITSEGRPSTAVQGYAEELAGELFLGELPDDGWQGSKDADRGHEIEPLAIRRVQAVRNADVRPMGFCELDDGSFGATPDGCIVGQRVGVEGKSHNAVLHVKALMRMRRQDFAPPAEHVAQCWGQALVCDFEAVDLIVFHPRYPSPIIRVNRDEKIERVLIAQIRLCVEMRDEALAALRELDERMAA